MVPYIFNKFLKESANWYSNVTYLVAGDMEYNNMLTVKDNSLNQVNLHMICN